MGRMSMWGFLANYYRRTNLLKDFKCVSSFYFIIFYIKVIFQYNTQDFLFRKS